MPAAQPIFEYIAVLGNVANAIVRVLSIAGLSTKHDAVTSDRGRLYGSITASGGVYTLTLCSDVARINQVLIGTTSSLGGVFSLAAVNGSAMSGSAVIDQYVADDLPLVVLPTFASDADMRRDIKLCAQFPGYSAQWGMSFFQADAIKAILTTWLPQELPHLFPGSIGLAAFVPTAQGATLPDLRKLASAGMLTLSQADLAEALACRQSIQIPAFAQMYVEAMARFDVSMKALKAANIQEKIAAVAEEASDRSGVTVSSFSRV